MAKGRSQNEEIFAEPLPQWLVWLALVPPVLGLVTVMSWAFGWVTGEAFGALLAAQAGVSLMVGLWLSVFNARRIHITVASSWNLHR